MLRAILILLLAATPCAAQFPADSTIERILHERVAANRSESIVVGILDADGNRRFIAAGSAGEGRGVPDANTVFEIGSITKVFTGILLAALVEEGRVRYEDPVASHLPPGTQMPSWNGREIMLVELSTQVSGLPRLPDLQPVNMADPYAAYGADELYAFLARHQLRRAPGEAYEYSNLGVGLLGHVLALAAGTTYEAAVASRISEPLGLDDTAVTLSPELESRFAIGHNALGQPVPYWTFDALAAAGALRSTAADMLDFLVANLDPPVSRVGAALAASHEPRARVSDTMRIGLGWHILSAAEGEIVWHNGGTAGFRTFIGFDKARRIGVVVLANSGGRGNDDLGVHLLAPSVPLEPPEVR